MPITVRNKDGSKIKNFIYPLDRVAVEDYFNLTKATIELQDGTGLGWGQVQDNQTYIVLDGEPKIKGKKQNAPKSPLETCSRRQATSLQKIVPLLKR